MSNQMRNNETVFGWEIHPRLLEFMADYQHLWWRENSQCGVEQDDLFGPVYVKAIIASGVAKLVRTPDGKSGVEPTPAYLTCLEHVDNAVRLLKLPPKQRVVDHSLTVREVKKLTEKKKPKAVSSANGSRVVGLKYLDAHTRGIEKEVCDALGLSVSIQPGNGEAGTLSIHYGNLDQLDFIATRLKA